MTGKSKPEDQVLPSDITIQVSTQGFPDTTVIEIKAPGGQEHQRADVVEMIFLHLGGLWTELADRIKTIELQDTLNRGLDG